MKDAYYFSHDSNARHDPKILSMISVYGMAGYGWYWVIIEILREQEDYKFSITKEHSYNAIAMQLYIDCNAAKKFIDDCINEFELFVSDGQCFWSESLLERMEYFNEVKQRRIEAGRLGGLKTQEIKAQVKQELSNTSSNAKAMLKQSSSNAKANKVKESKVKESILSCTKEIIDYLNNKTGKNFLSTTDKTKELIKARFNDGFLIEDFKKVIDNKVADWRNTEWEKFIRPVTLFGTKFESYLNEKPKKEIGGKKIEKL